MGNTVYLDPLSGTRKRSPPRPRGAKRSSRREEEAVKRIRDMRENLGPVAERIHHPTDPTKLLCERIDGTFALLPRDPWELISELQKMLSLRRFDPSRLLARDHIYVLAHLVCYGLHPDEVAQRLLRGGSGVFQDLKCALALSAEEMKEHGDKLSNIHHAYSAKMRRVGQS